MIEVSLFLQKMDISIGVIDYLRSEYDTSRGNPDLIRLLSSVTQEEMEYIMRCYIKPEKQTVFFKACVTQTLNVVKYLLQNCKPNVNDKCYFYNYEDDEAIFGAFPLWYAARKGNLELVKLLIQHGADVNEKTRSGSTAVHAACLADNFEIVTVLGDAGADISSADNKSSTCLMATFESFDSKIMEYLLNKGVDVNVRETAGNRATALHYVIRSTSDALPKVKALVEAGADMTIPDKNGYQPLILAAIAGKAKIMAYLLEKNEVSIESKFKAHVLLAASRINNGYDDEGLQRLCAAYDLLPEGYEHPKLVESITHFFPTVRVPRTRSDVMQLSNDVKALHAVVVLLASQHIAIESDFIISALHICNELYLGDDNRALILSMCSFVYNLILSRNEWFHVKVEECICVYVHSLGRMCMEQTSVSSDLQSEFDNLMNQLTNHIITASNEENFIAREYGNAGSIFQCLLIALLYMVNIGVKCHLRDENMKSDLRRLARVNPRTFEGTSLLHLLVSEVKLEFYAPIYLHSLLDPHLDLDVISCLVEQGFPLNMQDDSGKTPLSYVLTSSSLAPYIGKYFLEKGAHPDIQTENAFDQLEDNNIPPVNYLTLQCLAANVVVANGIPYHDEMLPAEVKSFIDLHAPYKQYENHTLHESLN